MAEDGVNYQYQSDFDLLVIVENEHLARKIERNGELKKQLHYIIHTPTNLIAHDIAFINKRLGKAQYFFSEIKQDGIVLFDSGQFELAEEDFKGWFERAAEFYIDFENALHRKSYKNAAFYLHQTTEFMYNTFLLVFTRHIPNTHDLRKLSKSANSVEPKFLQVFPQSTEQEK